MKAKVVTLIMVLVAGMAQATLIGSIHIDANQDVQDVDRQSGFTSRTSNGNLNTRGTVAGAINFLAGAPLDLDGDPEAGSNYAGGDLRSWSGSSTLLTINRFKSATSGGGIVTWDYNLSGVVNSDDYWALDLEFADHKASSGTAPLDSKIYVSYNNGSSLALDTADVSAALSHGANQFVGDAGKYTQIASISGLSGNVFVDLTTIIEDAQANGGTLRLAFVNDNFQGSIGFMGESGVITTNIPEPATLGMIALFGGAVLFIRRRFMI